MGRPTDLTPAKQARAVELVKIGMPLNRVAAAIGVKESTMRQWREKGRAGQEPYVAFAAAISEAQAELEKQCLQNILAAGFELKTWQSNAWTLERLQPKTYAAPFYKERAKATKAGEMAALKRSMTEALPLDEDGENALIEAVCSDPKLVAKIKERLGK